MKPALRILPLFLLVLLAAACKHEIPFPLPVPPGNGGGGGTDTVVVNPDPCDPDTVYFSEILPILVNNCSSEECHDDVNPEDDISLYNYDVIMSSGVVTPGNPGSSEMYEAITEDDPDDIMPPAPGGLTNEEINMIYTWIQQGALENSCTPDCDPAQFSFSQNIFPVINLACAGCHDDTNPSGGRSLNTYDEIVASALDGSLMGSLTATNGYSIMPDNTAGLPACNIEQIQNWINAGTPNN